MIFLDSRNLRPMVGPESAHGGLTSKYGDLSASKSDGWTLKILQGVEHLAEGDPNAYVC